jgi:hypothetical protein
LGIDQSSFALQQKECDLFAEQNFLWNLSDCTGCNALAGSCCAAAGYSFGVATLGVGVPARLPLQAATLSWDYSLMHAFIHSEFPTTNNIDRIKKGKLTRMVYILSILD